MRAKEIPPHLHARYGVRPPSRLRWVAAALAAAVVLPTGIYAASRYVATQQVPFALISWAALDEQHVQVLWQLDAAAERRWCVLRAQDFDHFDVGFAVVPVAPGVRWVEYGMATLERPLAVDVEACSADPYDLPGPQFPPGVRPPAQVAPGLAPGVYGPETLA
jgi:hypothetical protein